MESQSDIEQEIMSRFIFMMKMEHEPDKSFEQVEIGQDFSDSGGKNCAVVMTKRCISKMREKSVFIKICFQELRQCYDTVEKYMGELAHNEVQVEGEVVSKSDVKFPLERIHEIFLKLQRDNKELKQGIDRLLKHFPVDQPLAREVSDSGLDNAFRKDVNTRISTLEDEINDLRKKSSHKRLHHGASCLYMRGSKTEDQIISLIDWESNLLAIQPKHDAKGRLFFNVVVKAVSEARVIFALNGQMYDEIKVRCERWQVSQSFVAPVL